jgi:hypothetical protein
MGQKLKFPEEASGDIVGAAVTFLSRLSRKARDLLFFFVGHEPEKSL